MKNKRGITLIALIITIIVLLILAGVTMSFVVGDNGVINQAQKAKIRTEEEEAKEEIGIEVVGCYDGNGNIDLGLLNESLKKKGGVSFKETGESEFVELKEGEDENQIEELPVTVKYKNVEIEITGEYTGGVDRSKTASELTPQDDYGQYVDYGLDLGGDGNTKNDWKIFYTDETTDRIFLIAADYVPEKSCDALKSALASSHLHVNNNKTEATGETYGWCKYDIEEYDVPDYHCNDKHNLTLNSEKDQCSFPDIFMLARTNNTDEHTNNHYYCSSHVGEDGKNGNISSRCASSLQCTTNWKPFVDQSSKKTYAEYAIGGPTIEMWVASWNQKHGTDKDSNGQTLYANGNNNSNDETGYYVGDYADYTDDYIEYYVDECDGYNDTLYFPHHEYKDLKLFESDNYNGDSNGSVKCFGYRLASPCAGLMDRDGFLMGVWHDGRVVETAYDEDVGLRPVVSLKPGVKVEWKNNGYYEIVGK